MDEASEIRLAFLASMKGWTLCRREWRRPKAEPFEVGVGTGFFDD